MEFLFFSLTYLYSLYKQKQEKRKIYMKTAKNTEFMPVKDGYELWIMVGIIMVLTFAFKFITLR